MWNIIKKCIIFLALIIFTSYFVINFIIGDSRFNNFKSLFDYDKRQLIKKYIFPYKLISQQGQKISNLDRQRSQLTKVQALF